jgi:MSHA biogenesis protein MshP
MLLIAIFVIVVMGVFAANLARIQWSNQDNLTREALGSQAWFLAGSANEWAKTELFRVTRHPSDTELASSCRGLNQNDSAVKQQALAALSMGSACRPPRLTCIFPATSLPTSLKYYQVVSTARCGDGATFQVQRQQAFFVFPNDKSKSAQ